MVAVKNGTGIKVTLPKDKETPGSVRFGAKKVYKEQDMSLYLPKELLPDPKGPYPTSIDLDIAFNK